MTKKQLQAPSSSFLKAPVDQRTQPRQQSEALQAIILNAIPDLLLRYSGDGICLGAINAGEVSLLAPMERTVGRHLLEYLPSPMAEERLHFIHQALTTGKTQIHEYQFEQGGVSRYEESRIVPSGDDQVLVIIRDVTVQKQTEQAMRESQALYQSLTEVLPHCLYRTDVEGRLIFANPAFLKTLGKPLSECLGKTVYDFYSSQLAEQYMNDNRRVIESGITLRTVEAHQNPVTQEDRYVEVVKSPVYGANGQISGIQGVFWDVTDLKRTQDELHTQKQFLQQVIDNMPSATFVRDRQGRLMASNQANAAMHGMRPEDMIGKIEPEFNPNVSMAEMDRLLTINQQVICDRITVQEEITLTNIQGETRWYQTIISPFVSQSGEVQGIIGNCIDITERKAMESALQDANQELARLATLDSLTKVANRRRFDEYLQQEWQRMAREGQPLSLIMLDVDYFKIYNDFLGHQQGDVCLFAVAQALCRAVRRSADLVSRYGGEEFAVVLPNTRRAGAIVVAEAIRSEIAQLQIPHPNSTVSPYLTVSMGIASAMPDLSEASDDLVAAADASLYQAKRRGRDRYWVRIL